MVRSAVSPRSSLPVLQHVQLQSDDGSLVCTGTNLDFCRSIQLRESGSDQFRFIQMPIRLRDDDD